jgi:hypothetical protein
VPFIAGETYPDLGSNFEAFTNSELLELETCGTPKTGPADFVHDLELFPKWRGS